MKKKAIIVLTLGLVCALVGCQTQPTAESISTTVPSVLVTPAPTPSPSPTPTPTPTEWPTAEDIFPREFCFNSGSGGWATELVIEADGSFSGHYQDMDMGGNPPSTYFCNFKGQFSRPEKVNEYTYSMKMEQMEKDEAEEAFDADGMLWIPSEAYGVEGGEEFLIFLPGAPVDELPEYFFLWTAHGYGSWVDYSVLPDYGLYNVEEQTGFFAYTN